MITMLCMKHNVPQYVTDIHQPLHQPLTVALMRDYPQPTLYIPQAWKKGKHRAQIEMEDNEELLLLGGGPTQ